jgi:hypothetical protein
MFKEAKQFGMLFANPIPEEFALQKAEIDAAIDQAVQEAAEQGFHGHANTPFILSRIKDLTHGNSLPANRALIESNVAMAAKVAVELSKYDGPTSDDSFPRSQQRFLETLRKDFEFDRKKLDKMLATMNSPKASGNTENLVSAVQDKATQPHLGKEAVSSQLLSNRMAKFQIRLPAYRMGGFDNFYRHRIQILLSMDQLQWISLVIMRLPAKVLLPHRTTQPYHLKCIHQILPLSAHQLAALAVT